MTDPPTVDRFTMAVVAILGAFGIGLLVTWIALATLLALLTLLKRGVGI